MNSVIVDLPAGVPAPPDVRDVAWLIADADTGEVLAAKNPHAHLLPASTLKTLTAIHLLPRIAPETVLTATSTAANAEGTRVGMVAGATYTARQLFQALIMSSANDAA
jgi:D-alanyl-D-alanine carboxypeptidase (penicillin-binding protein 5/6)